MTIFLVNQRPPVDAGSDQDRAVIFQAELEVHCTEGFVPRPNLRGAHLTDDLDERMTAAGFAGWKSAEARSEAWRVADGRLKVGDVVTGVVIGRAHYGAWIDIGVRIPALLLIPYVAGLTAERGRAGDWCPPGSEIIATIRVLSDGTIGLEQTPE